MNEPWNIKWSWECDKADLQNKLCEANERIDEMMKLLLEQVEDPYEMPTNNHDGIRKFLKKVGYYE